MPRRSFLPSLFIVAALLMSSSRAMSQDKAKSDKVEENQSSDWDNAKWIWHDQVDDALVLAPAETVWFRKVVRGNEPSTGAIRIACDDHFVLWVNGQKIGEGDAAKAYRFNLNGVVERGPNVIAVEARNREGRAGLFVDGEIRGQSGKSIAFDTPLDWKSTLVEPVGTAWLTAGFDAQSWKPVKPLVAHQESPWKAIAFAGTYLDRFDVAPGFELKRIGEPELVGSLVCISWGNRGRLLASRERGPILNLVDENADGTYDIATEFTTELKNCQGLCMVGRDLIAVGTGPQGAGIYRLPDQNQDDRADSVQLIALTKGNMGEHGPHNVVLGPDGWLYHNLGNHAWITATPEVTTPCRNAIEGNLLNPGLEDANGHAVGIQAPGGTVWRFSPDGKKWWLETAGFRNHYDIAFNSKGDLFTFDSDMEWDVNLPWYRPVRINHCVPGAEFGWRSGAKNWPDYYFDSLPAAINVGRGSPTGVVFYEHHHFPDKYRGSMLSCDWSMGRLIVARLKPDGASYTGDWENLVTGNPLNISDVEVDRDGTVVFSTGGRNTEGGLYRLLHSATKPQPTPVPGTVSEVLSVPQGQSAWARQLIQEAQEKLGSEWELGLQSALKAGTPAEKIRCLSIMAQQGPKASQATLLQVVQDSDPGVRAFAAWLLAEYPSPETTAALSQLLGDKNPVVRRRACEAFVRSGLEPPVDSLLTLLSDEDRWLRFAGRIALERIPVEKWKTKGLALKESPDVLFNVLLALMRTDSKSITLDEIDTLMRSSGVKESQASDETRIRQGRDMLRIAELTAITYPDEWAEKVGTGLGNELAKLLQQRLAPRAGVPSLVELLSKDEFANHESARLVAWSQNSDAVDVLLGLMETSRDPASQIHYAMCLRYVRDGWTSELKTRLLNWFEATRKLEGGHSLQGYIRNIVAGTLDQFSPEERAAVIVDWKHRPHSARLFLTLSQPEQVQNFDQLVGELLTAIEKEADPALDEMVSATIEALEKSESSTAQVTLRKLFDEQPDRRDMLARSLAKKPTLENAPYYIRAMLTGDNATRQQCLQALRKSEFKSEKAEDFRIVIVTGVRLGVAGGGLAVQVLKSWTGQAPAKGANPIKALEGYQAWYAEKFPDSPPAELPADDLEKSKFSLQQLVDIVERGPAGDVDRGKLVFTKATCIKCHRFVKDGEGVGPDLTTVRRRFQKKEILESILFPSQVISDQYKAMTVSTSDGLIYTGMPISNPDNDRQLILLLSDATKVVVGKDKIEDQFPSKLSVMPEGLFKNLTEQEIADLFAFLETSRSNPEPAVSAK